MIIKRAEGTRQCNCMAKGISRSEREGEVNRETSEYQQWHEIAQGERIRQEICRGLAKRE